MKILICKVNQLGDNIVFLPVVQWLRRIEPAAGLFLYTTPTARPLYEASIPADRLFIVERDRFNQAWKRPWQLASLAWQSRRVHPDACLLAEDQGNTAHLLAALSGARHRVGTVQSYHKIRFGLTRDVPPSQGLSHAEWSWELLRALCRETGLPEPSERPSAPDLSHLVVSVPSFDFVIHPGGSLPYKRWHLDRYCELANRLSSVHRVAWIATGNPPTPDLGAAVHALQTPNMRDLVSVIAAARVFVGNNSGPMNVAQAVGTPSVILTGPSRKSWDPVWHAERFLMLRANDLPCICCDYLEGPRNHCTNKEHPMACMDAWPVDVVEKKCLEWLGKFATPAPLPSD